MLDEFISNEITYLYYVLQIDIQVLGGSSSDPHALIPARLSFLTSSLIILTFLPLNRIIFLKSLKRTFLKSVKLLYFIKQFNSTF